MARDELHQARADAAEKATQKVAQAAERRRQEEQWAKEDEEVARRLAEIGSEQWHRRMEEEIEEESRRHLAEIGRAVGAHMAEKVWGASWKQPSTPPKVFKLTGLSADEVRSVGSEVSQVATGIEERRAMSRMHEHAWLTVGGS